MIPRRSLVALVVGALSAQSAGAAQLVAPGAEADVQKLLEGPASFGVFTVEAIRVTEYAIEVRLVSPSSRLVVELEPVDATRAGRRVGLTKSFSIWLTGGQDALSDAAGQAVLDRVSAHDDGTFFERHQLDRASSPHLVEARDLGIVDAARRAAIWFALLALLSLSLWREPRQSGWWLFMAAVASAAILLRLTLPPWAPLHANTHGIAELRGLALSTGSWKGPVETDRYGYAYRQIVRAAIGLSGGHARAALAFSAVAGGLSVVPLMVLAERLFDSRAAAVVAGIVLALHPAHIALSLSESPMALAGLLFLIGLASRSAWISCLAIACASELSVATLFLGAAAIAAVLLWRPWRALRWPGLVLLTTIAMHVYSLWPVLRSGALERDSGTVAAISFGGLLTTGGYDLARDPVLCSVMLLPLAVVGGLALIVQRRIALVTGLVLTVVLPMIPALAVIACRTDLIRYQTVAHFGLILLASACATFVPRWPRLGATLVGAILVAPAIWHLSQLRTPSLDASAFLIAGRAVQEIPVGAVVRIAPRRDGEVLDDFPEYLTDKPIDVDDSAALQGNQCYVWLGPPCYSFTDEEVEHGIPQRSVKLGDAPMRRECHQPVDEIDAAALPVLADVVDVPWRNREFFHIPGEHPLIGLFPCTTENTRPSVASP